MNRRLSLFLAMTFLSSCLPHPGTGSLRKRVNTNAAGTNVGAAQGRILADNPIILARNPNLDVTYDLTRLLSAPVTITSNPFLQSDANCTGLSYCFEVKENKTSASALQSADGRWAYATSTEEFYEVNTFYHMETLFHKFFTNLITSYSMAYDLFALPYYDSAIPTSLYHPDGTFNFGITTPLTAFSNCDVEDNSYYDRASESLCFGYTKAAKKLRWASDSTIIYHETGHFFQKMQLNFRNAASLVKAQMGSLLYDEAGAIGEGISDFYSYYINGRTHWGEWAAGRILQASRPLTETDPLHTSGLSSDRDERLSYPQYLNYDPNFPDAPVEDIHLSGMIISHYLVALVEDLQSKCSMTKAEAIANVMHLISETLAEHGDLSSLGTVNGAAGKINHSVLNASLWLSTNNPLTFRSFSQTMAKNLLNTVGNAGLLRCNGSYYQRDAIESLLDDYGLLLFKTYNQHRSLADGVTKVNTAVTVANRKKSILIPKSALILDPSTDANTAFVIDNRAQITSGITLLTSLGMISPLSSQTPTDLGFNNGNSKVSPGEVVGISLNLYNNSNSTMGGIQVLANDWDHADTTVGTSNGKPCRFSSTLSSDNWPLEAEGGSVAANCNTIGASSLEFAPVCFVQSNETNGTKWISQKAFKDKIALDDSLCLDPSSSKDCFIRAIKGADKSYFSKINPKSTWGQTMADPTSGEALGLDWGNILLFEVSKHIPPGTVVDCRLRARFTNCEDCYHESTAGARKDYDFYDVEYNGPKPFKIIHLQIPIID